MSNLKVKSTNSFFLHSYALNKTPTTVPTQSFIRYDTIRDFFLASAQGNEVRITEILNLGIDVNIKDDKCYNFTALHHASANGKINCVKLLISSNSDVNSQNEFGGSVFYTLFRKILKCYDDSETPLHLASRNGFYYICKLLCENGGISDIKDVDGKSPFDLSNIEEIRVYLRKKKDERDKFEKEKGRLSMIVERFSDITIHSRKTLKLFCFQSKYLKKKIDKDEVIQESVGNEVMNTVINFLEGKKFEIKIENVYDLFKISRKWELDHFLNMIIKHVEVKVKNVDDIMKLMIEEYEDLKINSEKSDLRENNELGEEEKEEGEGEEAENSNFEITSVFELSLLYKCKPKTFYSKVISHPELLKYPLLLRKIAMIPIVKLPDISSELPTKIYNVFKEQTVRNLFLGFMFNNYNNLRFTNFTLVSRDKKKFPIHKEILILKSEYFCKMLCITDLWMESHSDELKIDDLDKSELYFFINFIYTESTKKVVYQNDLIPLLTLLIYSDKIFLKKLELHVIHQINFLTKERTTHMVKDGIILNMRKCLKLFNEYHFLFDEKFKKIKNQFFMSWNYKIGMRNVEEFKLMMEKECELEEELTKKEKKITKLDKEKEVIEKEKTQIIGTQELKIHVFVNEINRLREENIKLKRTLQKMNKIFDIKRKEREKKKEEEEEISKKEEEEEISKKDEDEEKRE